MKKIILSLAALFAVSIASAQSYPKQPDKTIVEYVNYQKPAEEPKAETAAETEKQSQGSEAKSEPATQGAKGDNKIEKSANPAILNSNKKGVAVVQKEE